MSFTRNGKIYCDACTRIQKITDSTLFMEQYMEQNFDHTNKIDTKTFLRKKNDDSIYKVTFEKEMKKMSTDKHGIYVENESTLSKRYLLHRLRYNTENHMPMKITKIQNKSNMLDINIQDNGTTIRKLLRELRNHRYENYKIYEELKMDRFTEDFYFE